MNRNAKLSSRIIELERENELLLHEKMKKNCDSEKNSKSLVENTVKKALSEGQFHYTDCQIKLMIKKRQIYKNKKLLYRPKKWPDADLRKVCIYTTISSYYSVGLFLTKCS